MPASSFDEFALEQLSGLPGLDTRAMFGALGLYLDGSFFGILHDGQAYFKTNDQTRPKYEAAGMSHFPPLKNYWEVPEDVLEHRPRLEEWAREAAAIPSPPRKKRSPKKSAKPAKSAAPRNGKRQTGS